MTLAFNMTDALSVFPVRAHVLTVQEGSQTLNFHHEES